MNAPEDAPTESTSNRSPPAQTSPTAGEHRGQMVGPYKLLDVLGEGGFGTVWLAERREPMVQRVALKIIKPGMDSRSVIARFEQERQALAVMDHPNVAKVFDGGVTEHGRPYFVMELVQGEPITTFCDRHTYTIKQRLELFIPVCEAVQHAHHKGIIHRDIKPSNILVTLRDEQAVPKVIDFGVAKAISHTMTEKTIFTEQGHLIGTPEYMSPEQAEMGALDIDTRTDVYSLGVVLYELLTGLLPFDSAELRSKGYAEIQRIIREVEPPTPSKRLTTIADEQAAALAAKMHAKSEVIVKELRRELEWIPLKAIRKDRTRRYATANELAEDVRAFLNGRPVSAAPESDFYHIRKWITRHRSLLFASTAGASIPLAASGFFVSQTKTSSLLLMIVSICFAFVTMLPASAVTLILSLRSSMKRSVSFEEAMSVVKWQFYAKIATLFLFVLYLILVVALSARREEQLAIARATTPKPETLAKVMATLMLAGPYVVVVPLVQLVTLKYRLRVDWRQARRVLAHQGRWFTGLLLVYGSVVAAIALLIRAARLL